MSSLIVATALMAAQLASLPAHDPSRADVVTPTSPIAPASTEPVTSATVSADTAAAPVVTRLPAVDDLVTRQEFHDELKKEAWKKGEFTIVPYGTVWGNMAYDTQRAKTGDYCLWIESPSTNPQDPDYNVDARSTRIGVDILGPRIPCLGSATIGGKLEVDFQGYYATRNRPGLMLRHAYVEAKSDEFRFVVGQTWDVISPLLIPTLNYTGGSAVGNLAFRRAQFRAERFFAVSDTEMITLQGALCANALADYVTDPTVSANSGPYPEVQARAAITLGRRDDPNVEPIVIGISGHGGEQNFDFRAEPYSELDVECPTWSICADLRFPLSDRWGFQGEFFHGDNLSNYTGGIMQGVDRITHQGIHSTGGWADIWFKWRPDLCSHMGYAVDDPANGDLTSGRTYNQMFFANIIYDVTKNLQLGMEADVWETHYVDLESGEAVRLECAMKYKF